MLKHAAWVVLLFTVIPIISWAQDVPPAPLPPATIAVRDTQAVLRTVEASQGSRTQVEAIAGVYSAEITELEDELRAAEQELGRQEAILAADVFAQRRREFQDRVDFVQRLVEQRNSQIDGAFNAAMTQVRDAMLSAVIDISSQRGANLVIEKTNFLFNARVLDITDAVVALINERLPNVNVPMPAGP